MVENWRLAVDNEAEAKSSTWKVFSNIQNIIKMTKLDIL